VKQFTVKPFIVKPFVVDLNAPQFHYFFLAGASLFLGVGFMAMSILEMTLGDRGGQGFTWAGLLAILLANALVGVARLVRDTNKSQAELTMRLTEQDERIRMLEAQLTALTTPSPTA
jgi:hypothetical protein